MAISRTQKEEIVDDLRDRFSRGRVTILTDFTGLGVASITQLRNALRAVKAEYRVAKNTLLKRAAENTQAQDLKPYFKGTRAVAISYEDPVAPAKVLVDFIRENKKLEIIAGLLEGSLITSEDVQSLAKLPGREELLARLFSTMQAVPMGLVQLLSGIPRKLLYVLKAIEEHKSKQLYPFKEELH
jgi:large subunit ribosomal protein L10